MEPFARLKKKVHHPKSYLTWEDWIMWCERASAPWVQITMTTNFLDKWFIYFHLKWLANSPPKTFNRNPNGLQACQRLDNVLNMIDPLYEGYNIVIQSCFEKTKDAHHQPIVFAMTDGLIFFLGNSYKQFHQLFTHTSSSKHQLLNSPVQHILQSNIC
jgi:hypothetical protein